MKMKTPSVSRDGLLAGFDVLQADGLDLVRAQDLGHHGVPDEVDLGMFGSTLLKKRAGAQLIAAMDDRHRRGVARDEQALFQGAVAAAHDDHLLVLEEPAVAGGAIGDTPAGQLILTRDLQLIRAGTGGDNDRIPQGTRRCRSSP